MGALDGFIGAFLVGTLLSTLLLGITTSQTWRYYELFPNDKQIYRRIVTGLLIINWLHSVTSCFTVYDWTVTHFGDLAHLANIPWSFALDPALTGLTAFVVQLFYAYRVYIVSRRSLVLPIAIAAFSVVQLGFAIGTTGQIFRLVVFAVFKKEWKYGIALWMSTAAAADLLVTASLVLYLVRSKRDFVQTNTVLNKLIQHIIENNALTFSVAVIDASLFGSLPNAWHVAANLCLVKLYINSLLASLNARVSLEKHLESSRGRSNNHSDDVITASGFTPSDCSDLFPRRAAGASRRLSATKPIVVSHQQTTTSDSSEKNDYDAYHSVTQASKLSTLDIDEEKAIMPVLSHNHGQSPLVNSDGASISGHSTT